MSRNSQIINALAMIPEAVKIWGRDTADSLKAQVIAQDRNIIFAGVSKGARLLTQVAMLGWGAILAIQRRTDRRHGDRRLDHCRPRAGADRRRDRGLAPVHPVARRLWPHHAACSKPRRSISSGCACPSRKGRLDVERLLFVPQGTKKVILNGISFSLQPGESLAIIGNSGAGKTTLGKMLVGSILPTSGNVRLDLMDLRNWDQRQFGESIGYLPQDVQLFPGTIKANIAPHARRCQRRADLSRRRCWPTCTN